MDDKTKVILQEKYGVDPDNLTRANLSKSKLANADLNFANLTGANLTRANLTGANLNRADLNRADLSGTKGIVSANFDNRGYQLVCWLKNDQPHFIAGCRNFSFDAALVHWGSTDYRNKERGQKYCEAVKFLANLIK